MRILLFILGVTVLTSLAPPARAQLGGMQVLGVVGLGDPTRNDPLANFDFLWRAFDREYAFFPERGVDWNAARTTYRSRLDRTSDDVRLYEVCRDMLESLQDEHVTLVVPASVRDLARPGRRGPAVDSTEVQQAVFQRYVPQGQVEHGGKIRWGSIDERAGYFQINTMEEFGADSDADVLAVRKVMDRVVREFARKELVILDIRFNGGGYDDVPLEIMRRFVDRTRLVFTRKTRVPGAGFTRPERVRIEPATSRLGCRVAILQSPETASAAEILSIISLPYAHMTRIGSRTNGILSDKEEGTMPNGWTYSLSNMWVQAFDGALYEVTGVPPVQTVDYPRDPRAMLQQILQGLPQGDPAVETALGRGPGSPPRPGGEP